MTPSLPMPDGITNEPQWRKHCRKIHARAQDLIDCRMGVIETARALYSLAVWTKVENEPEFILFRTIESETDHLPVGPVREKWAAHALVREDIEIRTAENYWRAQALRAAVRLAERYKWAVERVSTDPHQRESNHVA